jgi:hypothetical protein
MVPLERQQVPQVFCNSSGSRAIFTAIRRASLRAATALVAGLGIAGNRWLFALSSAEA